MRFQLLKIWDDLRGSYWFIPVLMSVGAILLSGATIALDGYFQAEVLFNLGFIWSGGPEGARGILETVAGSMITVAGVTFSITVLALSFASSQFGSRLLRSFMMDTSNQLVLGTFISTFIYCLLTLRTVRGGENDIFVPYLSITVGMILALVSLMVLIYFIHHMALNMQAPYVIGKVAGDLLASIDRLFPEDLGEKAPPRHETRQEQDIPTGFDELAKPIFTEKNGYLQAIDEDELMEIAAHNNLILKLLRRPGHFLVNGGVLIYAWPAEHVDEDVARALLKSFIVGKQRTDTQDVEFGIEQLVEVAERSLSSAINATFTALTCIDWLTAALAKLSRKGFPSSYRYGPQGNLRVFFAHPLSMENVVDTALNQIRQVSETHVVVQIHLLEKIGELMKLTEDEGTRNALIRQARMIKDASDNHLLAREDQADVERRYQIITDETLGS